MVCPTCGNQNEDNASFCTTCGAQLSASEQQQTAQPDYSQAQGNYSQPQGGYAQPQGGYAQPQGGYAQQQGGYSQPPMYVSTPANVDEIVSVKDWFLSMLIMCIPLVNVVMIFVWAFGSGTPKSKSNYFKASLIWALIGIAISIIFTIIFVAAGVSMYNYF